MSTDKYKIDIFLYKMGTREGAKYPCRDAGHGKLRPDGGMKCSRRNGCEGRSEVIRLNESGTNSTDDLPRPSVGANPGEFRPFAGAKRDILPADERHAFIVDPDPDVPLERGFATGDEQFEFAFGVPAGAGRHPAHRPAPAQAVVDPAA